MLEKDGGVCVCVCVCVCVREKEKERDSDIVKESEREIFLDF